MNGDQEHNQQNIELPMPQQHGDNLVPVVDSVKASAEKQSMSAELPQVTPSLPPASAAQDSPATLAGALAAATPALPSNTKTHTLATNLTAEDTDLIEKEWVLRAKSIVDKTKNDPHLQNSEMSQFKADYIKKRYNKELKVTEG